MVIVFRFQLLMRASLELTHIPEISVWKHLFVYDGKFETCSYAEFLKCQCRTIQLIVRGSFKLVLILKFQRQAVFYCKRSSREWLPLQWYSKNGVCNHRGSSNTPPESARQRWVPVQPWDWSPGVVKVCMGFLQLADNINIPYIAEYSPILI